MSSTFQAKQTLKRDGVSVDLWTFETGGSTSRGTAHGPTAESPETIPAIPDPGGKSISYGTFGVEVEADMVYLVAEDLDLDDGGGEGASAIVQDGKAFRVIEADRSQRHGFLVLECELDREFNYHEEGA